MLKWKTRIKNNDLLIDSVDFQGNQLSNRSMVVYIILVVLLAWAFWKQDTISCLHSIGKASAQRIADFM
jgi:hypothetical protein